MDKYLIKKHLFNPHQATNHFPKFSTSLWTELKYKPPTTDLCFRKRSRTKCQVFAIIGTVLMKYWVTLASGVCRSGQNSFSSILIVPGEQFPSLIELAASTWTGHTNSRHQCYQTQCHQCMHYIMLRAIANLLCFRIMELILTPKLPIHHLLEKLCWLFLPLLETIFSFV